MPEPFEGKGRKQVSTAAAFPLLFEASRVHPGVFLFASFSFIFFMLAISPFAWRISVSLWFACTLLGFFNSSRFTKAAKRMIYALPFLGFSMFFHLFFTPGTFRFSLGPLHATLEGLRQGVWITQKLAFFFWISLLVTSANLGLFPYQVFERASRLPVLRRTGIRMGIIVLFLILRWHRVLPASWKKQFQQLQKVGSGRFEKTRKKLRHLPQILSHDLIDLDRWVTLFIARGYEEGILRLAETPLSPFSRADTLILCGTCISWGMFFIYKI